MTLCVIKFEKISLEAAARAARNGNRACRYGGIGVKLLPKPFHLLVCAVRSSNSLFRFLNLPLECREEVLRFLFLCQVRSHHAS